MSAVEVALERLVVPEGWSFECYTEEVRVRRSTWVGVSGVATFRKLRVILSIRLVPMPKRRKKTYRHSSCLGLASLVQPEVAPLGDTSR